MGAGALTIPSIFKGIDQLSSVTRKMGGSVKNFVNASTKDVARLNRSFRSVKNTASNISRNFFIAGAAIAAPLVIATKTAVDFEKQMGNIATLVDTNVEDMGAMGEKVLDLSTEIPKPIEELTTGLYDIRSAGIAADQAMGVLEASGKLATAGLGSTADATNIMTSAMNAFASEGLTAEQIADTLFKTVKAGKTTVEQLSQGFGATAPMVQSAGIKLADFQAATAALTTVGTPTVQAQNQIRAAIVALQKPSADMTRIFKQMGVASGNDLIKKYGTLGQSLKAVTKTAEDMGINVSEAFGRVEATAAVTSLTGATNKAYTDTLKEMTAGANALEEGFEKQMGTTAAQAQLAQNNLQMFSITVGTTLLPVLTDLLKWLTPIIRSFSNWARDNPGTLKTIVKIAAGIAVASFAFSGLAKSVSLASGVLQILTTTIGGTTVAQMILNAVMTANPIGLIVVGIAALITALGVAISYYDDFGAAMTFVLGPLGMIINLVQSFRRNWDMITEAFKEEGILGGLKAIGKTLLDAVLYPLQQILEIAANLTGFDWAKNAANSIKAMRKELGVKDPQQGEQLKSLSRDDVKDMSPEEQRRIMLSASAAGSRLKRDGGSADVVSPLAVQTELTNTNVERQEQHLNISLDDPNGLATITTEGNDMPSISSTGSAF